MITRIAPTPSGFLHKGNLYNFLLNWLWARARGGRVLLRIDDADTERKRTEYVEDIFVVLDRMGLDWDIGPSGPDDLEGTWSQKHRRDLYEEILGHLTASGHVYACSCSRSQLKENDSICHCREIMIPASADETALKMKVPISKTVDINDKSPVRQSISDFVLRKKDGWPAYPLTSLADDRHFGITHIVRGQDLLESTARQLYIDSILPDPKFQNVHFRHHPLLLHSGEKISKSAGAQSVSLLAAENPDELLKEFVEWMGWDQGIYRSLKDLQMHPDLAPGGQF